jgi:hypothetical protein
MTGRFLPPQLIYGGKTDQCQNKDKFPDNFHITHSENHWANGSTLIEYLQNIVTSFVDEIQDELDLPVRQKALAIFDCFRYQITEDFLYTLKSKILVYVTIPPNCTYKLKQCI